MEKGEITAEEGSSPLARGLQSPAARRPRGGRIIPARAGFTSLRRRWRCSSRGSSPLARGLRLERPSGRDQRRIIPARAGFTCWWRQMRQSPADHPRSRGVYVRDRAKLFGLGGSSPLARGLQLQAQARPHPRGIIPARAGFTGAPKTVASPEQDHPRSRGVYVNKSSIASSLSGSSPLARGLLA